MRNKDRTINVTIKLDGERIGAALGREDVMPFIRDIVSMQISYELCNELFEYAMERMVGTAKDQFADEEVKLEADELVTKWVLKFREALHGGKAK